MIVYGVIQLLKGIESPRKVSTNKRWIVVTYAGRVEAESVFVIVGEVGNFL